jgi:hypothetical protein
VAATAAAVFDRDDPVIRLTFSGRPERERAGRTLEFILNHLPVRLATGGHSRRASARRALDADNELLPYRHFPCAALRAPVGADPFEVSFRYGHFHLLDDPLVSELVTEHVELRDPTNLPVRVEALNDPHPDAAVGIRGATDSGRTP